MGNVRNYIKDVKMRLSIGKAYSEGYTKAYDRYL